MLRRFLPCVVFSAIFMQFCLGEGAAADGLPAPTGEVVLTIEGDIAVGNGAKTAAFDMAMLERLTKSSITTSTVWTDGDIEFEGVSLQTLMKAVGAEGHALSAFAIDDYRVEIPAEDIAKWNPIVAYRMNGAAMPKTDKGPLWVIYPYSANPELQADVFYSRAIWQLNRLQVQ